MVGPTEATQLVQYATAAGLSPSLACLCDQYYGQALSVDAKSNESPAERYRLRSSSESPSTICLDEKSTVRKRVRLRRSTRELSSNATLKLADCRWFYKQIQKYELNLQVQCQFLRTAYCGSESQELFWLTIDREIFSKRLDIPASELSDSPLDSCLVRMKYFSCLPVKLKAIIYQFRLLPVNVSMYSNCLNHCGQNSLQSNIDSQVAAHRHESQAPAGTRLDAVGEPLCQIG